MISNDNPNSPIEYGASFKSNTNNALNVAEAIVLPAANLRGLVIWRAAFQGNAAATPLAGFLAKSSAPANILDGDLILQNENWGGYAGTNIGVAGKLEKPIFIAAGKGLYFLSDTTLTVTLKSVLYDLLP